jgi:adenylate cyclase
MSCTELNQRSALGLPARRQERWFSQSGFSEHQIELRTPMIEATLEHSRHMAAILAADVVSYTELMGRDEDAALEALKRRRLIFDRLVIAYGGREFGCVGDSLMAQFPSAVNAVRCAQSIQRSTAEENATLPAVRRMQLRIGVNLGDVIEENGSTFGDAVNIAARLQSLAKPGGVLISGAVFDQVHHRMRARFVDAGARQVKNVAEPVRTCEVHPCEAPGLSGSISGLVARAASRRVRCTAGRLIALVAAVALGVLWGGLHRDEASQCTEASFQMEPMPEVKAPTGSVVVNEPERWLLDTHPDEII